MQRNGVAAGLIGGSVLGVVEREEYEAAAINCGGGNMGKYRTDRDHCVNGHDLRIAGEEPNGSCKACRRARQRRRMSSLRAEIRLRRMMAGVDYRQPTSAGDM